MVHLADQVFELLWEMDILGPMWEGHDPYHPGMGKAPLEEWIQVRESDGDHIPTYGRIAERKKGFSQRKGMVGDGLWWASFLLMPITSSPGSQSNLGNFYEEWQSISMVMAVILNPHLPSWFSKVTGESGIGGVMRMIIGTLPTSVFLCPYWEGQVRGENDSYVGRGRGWRQVLYPLWPVFSFLMTSMTAPYIDFSVLIFFSFSSFHSLKSLLSNISFWFRLLRNI